MIEPTGVEKGASNIKGKGRGTAGKEQRRQKRARGAGIHGAKRDLGNRSREAR